MNIKFGPAGIGTIKNIDENLEKYNQAGIRAAEIPFTYGIYITKQEDIERVKKAAEKNNIQLTIHAPYWINLNSKEKHKVEQSKQRILKCCEIGHKLGANRVVFHPGFYTGLDPETTYQNIKSQILEMQKIIKNNKWEIKLAPETMGKTGVFGSIEQIARLVNETGCSFTIDFAHILARDKKVDYNKLNQLFPQKTWHCHFSGIEYSEKGERRHIPTPNQAWKELIDNLPKDKEIIIINEAPNPIEDSVEGLEVWEELISVS